MPELTSIEQALARCATALTALPAERRPLEQALGRVLRAPAAAAVDLPPFRQSAMDGYAVRAADVQARQPAELLLRGEVPAGVASGVEVGPGECVRIFTGGAVPLGADAVVRQEVTERQGERVLFHEAAPQGNNIREPGEEIRRGDVLLEPGARLTPGRIGALAAAGIAEVEVAPAPRVSALITGNEVVALGSSRSDQAVFDANGPMIRAHLTRLGCEVVDVRQVEDTAAAVEEALETALAASDLVLTTGGVSVGDYDLVVPTAEKLGLERLFWKVAQKPGKPLLLARSRRGVGLLGLPGNPAAVAVGLNVYLPVMLAALEGTATTPAWRTGRLSTGVAASAGRDHWVRAALSEDAEGRPLLEPLPAQASHMLSNLCRAGALVHVPAGEELSAGSSVRWLSLV